MNMEFRAPGKRQIASNHHIGSPMIMDWIYSPGPMDAIVVFIQVQIGISRAYLTNMWFSHPGVDEPASRLIGCHSGRTLLTFGIHPTTQFQQPWNAPENFPRIPTGSRILFQASIFSGSYIDYIVNFLGCIYVSTNQLQPIGSLFCGADLVPQKFSLNSKQFPQEDCDWLNVMRFRIEGWSRLCFLAKFWKGTPISPKTTNHNMSCQPLFSNSQKS